MYENICCNCMAEVKLGPQETLYKCPQCGSGADIKNDVVSLQPRVVLNKKYLIGRCLGSGGFGITYLGLDLELRMRVVVKEFLPRNIVRRQRDQLTVFPISEEYAEDYRYGLTKFIDEAQTLAQFNHPSIAPILFFFKENNTAYFVMRYFQGKTLEEHIKLHDRGITQQDILDIMMPVLDGLEAVHNAGLLHRDIKPKNIYIPDNGRPILLDFGSARDAISTKLSICLTHGYAPLEQYSSDMKLGKQGPWTDIYACAATMYSCLRGYNYERNRMDSPTKAPDRQSGERLIHIKDISRQPLSEDFANAIMKGLEMDIKQRPASVAEFQGLLTHHVEPSTTSTGSSGTDEVSMELLVIAGEFEGERIPLGNKPTLIGRDPTKCALVLSEKRISSVHCEVHSEKDDFYVKDLRSTFGTFLDDNKKLPPFESTLISPGDTFSLAGCAVFQLVKRPATAMQQDNPQPANDNLEPAPHLRQKNGKQHEATQIFKNEPVLKQNPKIDKETKHLPIAPRTKRLLNFTIDLTVVCIATLILQVIVRAGLFGEGLVFITLYIMYYTVMEGMAGKTVAKFITHTRVVMADGLRVPVSNIIIRSLSRAIPFEPFSFLLNKDWHDAMSRTIVIDDKPSE
ncbi:MAG: protein kinase [Nitrospirae bacterium]|nr:protein kinase [Nitrospirota bacterium]